MRIERRKVITIEMSAEEAKALRRVIDGVDTNLDEDAERISKELYAGLGQNLYETRENYA